jgi:hypothetical protein
MKLIPLGTLPIIWPIVPIPDDDDDDVDACGAVGGRRSTLRKPVPVPICLPQIPHKLTCARTWAAAVGSQGLTV